MKTAKATSHAHDLSVDVSKAGEIATMSVAAAPAAALPYIKAPPPITLPPVPTGFTTAAPGLRTRLPCKAELELMPDVMGEMSRFADYADVFGKTAPSKDAAEQTLSSAYQWSTLRILLRAWEEYAHAQETMAWVNARGVMARLSPAFTLAVKSDASVSVHYPSLGNLFGVRASIARRAVASRTANALEKKEGRAPYKGEIGKRRKAADAKAALAAQAAAAKAEAAAVTSTDAAAGATPQAVPMAPH